MHNRVVPAVARAGSKAQALVTDIVFVDILVISALAFTFGVLLRLVERCFVRWSGHQSE